jgi:hypothetical protein
MVDNFRTGNYTDLDLIRLAMVLICGTATVSIVVFLCRKCLYSGF